MGMYTHVALDVRLVENVPTEVLSTLLLLINYVRTPISSTLTLDYCVMGDYTGEWKDDPNRRKSELETVSWGDRRLHIRSSFKNYHGELEDFLAWLSPYVAANEGEVLGTHEYEECIEPSNIVYRNGALCMEEGKWRDD
jgi:hypothetical protein